MRAEVHPLMQNAGDEDSPFRDTVNDDVPAGGEYAMRGRQLQAPVANFRMLPDGRQRLVE